MLRQMDLQGLSSRGKSLNSKHTDTPSLVIIPEAGEIDRMVFEAKQTGYQQGKREWYQIGIDSVNDQIKVLEKKHEKSVSTMFHMFYAAIHTMAIALIFTGTLVEITRSASNVILILGFSMALVATILWLLKEKIISKFLNL